MADSNKAEDPPAAVDKVDETAVAAETVKTEIKEEKPDVKVESTGDLSVSVGSAAKESLADAKPVIKTEILVKSEGGDAATSLEQDIIKQVEYYFGDANLARDKFLTEEIGKDDGWVTLEVLLRFKRLAALSADANVIVDALLKSKDDLLQISQDRLKVRRNPGRILPEQNEETRKLTIARTAYVKGFPATAEMPAVLKFFDGIDGVSNVVMRRYLDKPSKEYKFKGSVFVAFATKEMCAKFLTTEAIEFDGKPLERKWQTDYYESKKEERQHDKKKKVRTTIAGFFCVLFFLIRFFLCAATSRRKNCFANGCRNLFGWFVGNNNA